VKRLKSFSFFIEFYFDVTLAFIYIRKIRGLISSIFLIHKIILYFCKVRIDIH